VAVSSDAADDARGAAFVLRNGRQVIGVGFELQMLHAV